MLRFASCLALACLCGGQASSPVPDYRNPQVPIEQRVRDLLKRMTLEEKVAQTHSRWSGKAVILDDRGNFSAAKAKEFLGYGMGEITYPGERKSPRETVAFTNAVQKWVLENTRLGIPVTFNEEGLHGYMAPGSTSFPSAIGLAGTWDPALVERVFSVVAREMRARGAQHALAPVLDLARDPRWGRTEETYGEDPYLVSRIGVACIRGLQGGNGTAVDERHVLATAKHFAVHGQPENGINAGPGNYSERVIREQFLAPFQAAVTEGGVQIVLPSYNEIDGIPSHANEWLLDQVLRREWGFQGYTVSDYGAIADLETLHHVVSNQRDAAKKALESGVDQDLSDPVSYATLAAQIREGRIDEAVLDRAVARILRVKFLAGLFEHRYADPDEAERVTNSPEHRELAAQAARETVILLKNEAGLLPLDRAKLKTIAVIGPNAARAHLGGYSGEPGLSVSILDGIRKKAGAAVTVAYAEGCKITKNGGDWEADEAELNDPASDAKLIEEAVRTAKAAQVAVVVVGDNESTSREAWSPTHLGDRDSLDLVGRQNDLVQAVVETGTPTIVFLINGRPAAIPWIAEHVPAILEGWYLGEETGTAAADVLFGDYNPAGRLPITIPRSAGQLPMFYNHKPSARRGYLFSSVEPLFPFGYGLSYTTFEYQNLKVAPEKIPAQGRASVSVDVTNTGGRAGDEVVEMYIRDLVSSVTRPVKELKGFERVSLQPGETRTVRFEITPAALSFLNEEMKRVVEPGAFDIMVGPSSAKHATVRLEVE